MKAAHELEACGEAFADTMAAETGVSPMWADFNVHLAAGMLIEAAALTTQVGGEVIPSDVAGSLALALALRVSAGVMLGIAPWNAPVILGVRAVAVPLACGKLDDADLDAAAAAFGAFANSGQVFCMSTERIVVDRSIADTFVAKLRLKAESLPIGDPRDTAGGSKVPGSVVDRATAERCNALIDDALALGATLVCGGKTDSLSGGPGAWRGASSRASATSTARRSTTRPRCRSAASRRRAMAASAARPASTFTELRWITLRTTPRHYPF